MKFSKCARFLWTLLAVSTIFIESSLAFRSLYEYARLLSSLISSKAKIRRIPEAPTTVSIIKKNGYPAETHLVPTEDGYILEMHRIPHSRNIDPNNATAIRMKRESKYPVLVQHGNFQSSADWVINYPIKDALAFTLADEGYDVWLGNQRGNDYSYRHREYPLSSNNFWNFSFHEIGTQDVPAMLDYITNLTAKPKVNYIGFSMGTTAFFAGLSKRPEYNNKINMGVMLGPTPFQEYFLNGAVRLVSAAVWAGEIVQNVIGTIPALPQFITNVLHRVLPILCSPRIDVFGVCINVIRLAFGDDHGNIEGEKMQVITSVFPSPNSMKMFLHIMQLIATAKFTEYDYGTARNMKVYNRANPPDYNLTNIRVPISIIVGENDIIGHPEDAKTLASKLPNVVDFHYVPNPHFTHLDFTYAKDTRSLVYNHVLEVLNNTAKSLQIDIKKRK